jgi:hypothetical protein
MANANVGTKMSLTRKIFRYLCLLTAVANAGGNVVILLFYRPIFGLLGVPLPRDMFSFTFVSGFSFTVGVLAFMIFLDPEKNVNLLVVGTIGKAIYSLFTFYFFYEEGLHWFYRVFGVWDGAFALIFLLFLIHLVSSDLAVLNDGVILPGLDRTPTRRALLLYHSLTGNGAGAVRRVKDGLTRSGYVVDEKAIEATESLFHFPFKLSEFVRIMLRAIFRRPATIKPLGIPADHPYDLIVVACQTWFIGMGAPTEAIFADPANTAIFAGRDAAVVTVCRGLWRRTQAMTIRHLQESGANVVGARAFANPGWEPARTFSLFIFLAAGKEGSPRWLGWFLQPQHLDEPALTALERFGEELALRQRINQSVLMVAAARPATA